MSITQFFPIIAQFNNYNRQRMTNDLVAACVVTIMLIPQSLAYAMLAGVPPQVGLYASILPLVAYALFGSCNTLAVGPVAIASLMTASALGQVTQMGIIGYLEGAMLLAMLSGIFLILLGVLRLGFLSNFLSHSVVSGFITASGLVIALSQAKHILGVDAQGHNFVEMFYSISKVLIDLNWYTLALGLSSILFLIWSRDGAVTLLKRAGLSQRLAFTMSKTAPVLGVAATTAIVAYLALDQKNVSIIGQIPVGIPAPSLPMFSLPAVKALLLPAILISIIGYVESVSVGRTLSAKRREKIDGNQELIGLGAANIASSISGAFPVTGGFARSVVNYDAGAETQFAAIFTAIGIAIAAWTLTPLLYYLPNAMLAATIIVAVLSLVDFSVFKRAWNFSKSDFMAVLITVLLTLTLGVEIGVACGIITSILLHLHHTSEPHIAEVGLVHGTEHFRNVQHYKVETAPHVVSLRVDESLLFSNASYLEDYVNDLVFQRDEVSDVVLHCAAINTIDLSALEMLEALNLRLREQGIRLHLSEVKVPVENLLSRSGFLDHLSGSVYLSQYVAYQCLTNSIKNKTAE